MIDLVRWMVEFCAKAIVASIVPTKNIVLNQHPRLVLVYYNFSLLVTDD